MPRLALLPLLPMTVLLAVPALHAAPPDALDRQRLVAHLEMTESWLTDEVSGLSPSQLTFRPTPKSWSVLDCVEHLVLAENNYWVLFQEAMAQKPVKKESPSEDIDRLWYGIDRTQRTTTVESEVPKARFTELTPALAEFRALRAKILSYARTSQEDWRHHLIPDWDRDGYQWMLMISAHSQRHILQMREIKHNKEFPQR